jgi:hypothetical protein
VEIVPTVPPNLELKMPLPAGEWLLTVECGGTACDGVDDDFHKGDHFYSLDFVPTTQDKYNSDILAAADGEVVEAGYNEYNGNFVRIDHGFGFRTVYLHFREPPLVKVGQKIGQGKRLGMMGKTGITSGPPDLNDPRGTHLHFGITFHGSGSQGKPVLYYNVTMDGLHLTDYRIRCSGLKTTGSYKSTNLLVP